MPIKDELNQQLKYYVELYNKTDNEKTKKLCEEEITELKSIINRKD